MPIHIDFPNWRHLSHFYYLFQSFLCSRFILLWHPIDYYLICYFLTDFVSWTLYSFYYCCSFKVLVFLARLIQSHSRKSWQSSMKLFALINQSSPNHSCHSPRPPPLLQVSIRMQPHSFVCTFSTSIFSLQWQRKYFWPRPRGWQGQPCSQTILYVKYLSTLYLKIHTHTNHTQYKCIHTSAHTYTS